MQPDVIRKRWGLVAGHAAALSFSMIVPAAAQVPGGRALSGSAPMALALGAAALGIVVLGALVTLKRRDSRERRRAGDHIAGLRALVDQYESVLSGWREITVIWTEGQGRPRFLGQPSAILPLGRPIESVLELTVWLPPGEADRLAAAIEGVRVHGRGFDLMLSSRDGRIIRVSGWPTGSGAALRVRPAAAPAVREAGAATGMPALAALIEASPQPAFLRDADGVLRYANAAYLHLAGGLAAGGAVPELIEPAVLTRHLAAIATSGKAHAVPLPAAAAGRQAAYDLVETAIAGGSVGYLTPRHAPPAAEPAPLPDLGHIAGVIDALGVPVAIFDARRELAHFNAAYANMWGLDPDWLRTRPDERDILDRLRTAGQLPAEPNYQEWRERHLAAYRLTEPRISDPWHLPDGRTVVITAAPAGPQGGVIYVFDDQTARLELESRNRALVNVQRETLNALTEAVAVFGTNGRLTLFNPRFSSLWKLPTNELERDPHVDRIVATVVEAMPEDGAGIWGDLKRRIIDLNPTRSDASGRIARADGRLLDYAVVRLPDGQSLLTFLDVTESANYSRVLKERNEALVTADRLKDAFVQNVSYELRSPLTNIIGFADLLASGTAGPLNQRQRDYTGYIRASSVTLGVLIDNILDLATVDAGIAELRPELQDIPALVEKARAGLAATFPHVDGEAGLNLVVAIADRLPAFRADGTRLVQILYNLLSNAARFSEPGGIVRLEIRPRGERMLFVVEDEGAPVSEEMRAAVIDNAAGGSGRQRGAGLGLAIVRSFVSLHGGTITSERREPRGTRVIVSLPLDAGAAISAAE